MVVVRQVHREYTRELTAADAHLRDAVVERHGLVERPVRQGPRRQIGAQASAVQDRRIGPRYLGEQEIDEQVAERGLAAVFSRNRRS